eukprot:COSAG01_NODE_2769_length_7102_cov_6.325146_1_plen_361_part_00
MCGRARARACGRPAMWRTTMAKLLLVGLAEQSAQAGAGKALSFLPCGTGPETWSLQPIGSGSLLVQLKSAGGGGGCIAASEQSGAVATAPCNASDPLQAWEWNGTAHNVLLKGSRGFVCSGLAGLGCKDKGGAGSEGCCLTNNGEGRPAAIYGCCPSGPSDCGNQIITLHADSTLRDARHTSSCLADRTLPPRIETFEKLGMMDYESYESTPFVFHGKKLLMETIALVYPGHISHWKPQYKSCSSYYRIRDLGTGIVLRNLTESCNHSFGSAFVDMHENGTETLWVVGSSWWRPSTAYRYRGAGAADLMLAASRDQEGWGGTCSNGIACTIGSFRTTDPALQDFTVGTALSPGKHQLGSV